MTSENFGRQPAAESDDDGGVLTGVRPVRKAHEQIYDQLRAMILSGRLRHGHQFPPEPELARQFGVSRTTARRALQLLASDGLIRTTNGAAGGSFVTLPSVDRVSERLTRSVELLSHTDDVSLAEFLEAREVLEVFALRRLAQAGTPTDIKRLRATAPDERTGSDTAKIDLPERSFHRVLAELCGNVLLQIAAQPIHFVLETRLQNSAAEIGVKARKRCRDQHAAIVDAVEGGDADAAEELMRSHLSELAAVYETVWAAASTDPLSPTRR